MAGICYAVPTAEIAGARELAEGTLSVRPDRKYRPALAGCVICAAHGGQKQKWNATRGDTGEPSFTLLEKRERRMMIVKHERPSAAAWDSYTTTGARRQTAAAGRRGTSGSSSRGAKKEQQVKLQLYYVRRGVEYAFPAVH